MAAVTELDGLAPSERAELEWLLASDALSRSANLSRVLRYICEETAAGRADQIKEYSIAVDALGRKPDFDPQNDTIVRVTVHTLRKRLQDLYDSSEGAKHPIRIVVPAGRYGAQFIHLAETPVTDSQDKEEETEAISAAEEPADFPAPPPHEAAPRQSAGAFSRGIVLALLAVAILGVGFAVWRWHHRTVTPRAPLSSPASLMPATVISGPAHILLGQGRHAFTDHSGDRWEPLPTSCAGGEPVPPVGGTVAGTEDPAIYDGGLRGFVRCTFHVRPGLWELHIFFAEPTSLEPAQRVVSLSVNAGKAQTVDVVDRAGGDHTATMFTLPGIAPENDGTIHLDFTSEVSPVTAVELLPAPSPQPLPIRLVAASSPYKDESGNVWLSDRFFRAGRHGQSPDSEHSPGLGLYRSNRIGSFQYDLPAPVGSRYKVTLYFREPWFGQDKGAPGNVGSRIFDVYCNGKAVLTNFDILAAGHGAPVSRTIEGLSPTPGGLLRLEFVPVVNYPLVNAIQVEPQG